MLMLVHILGCSHYGVLLMEGSQQPQRYIKHERNMYAKVLRYLHSALQLM